MQLAWCVSERGYQDNIKFDPPYCFKKLKYLKNKYCPKRCVLCHCNLGKFRRENVTMRGGSFREFCLSYLCSFFFRAEIIIGGFVVKELSSDPPSCLVTYITRVDLKGRFSLNPSAQHLLRFQSGGLRVETPGQNTPKIRENFVDYNMTKMSSFR